MSTTYLGPLGSISGGNRKFFVDVYNQLNTNEYLSSINAPVSSRAELLITGASILSGNLTTKDGYTLYSGQCIQFWATASGNYDILATVTLSYTTNYGTTDSTLVYLRVLPSV